MTESVIAKMWHSWRCQACTELNWRDAQQISQVGVHSDQCEHCGYKHMVLVQNQFVQSGESAGVDAVKMYTQDELCDLIYDTNAVDLGVISAKLNICASDISAQLAGNEYLSEELARYFGYVMIRTPEGRRYVEVTR